jgi:hypothetical protein
MVVRGKLHVSRKNFGDHYRGGNVASKAGLDVSQKRKKFLPTRIRTPHRSARSLITMPNTLPWLTRKEDNRNKKKLVVKIKGKEPSGRCRRG